MSDSKLWLQEKDDREAFYASVKKYYDTSSPTVDTTLGGLTHLAKPDVMFSCSLIKELIDSDAISKTHLKRALDVGAGEGRVSENVLSLYFDEIDLVEPNESLVKASVTKSPHVRIKKRIISSIEKYIPTVKYGVVWAQWVFSHILDRELSVILKNIHGYLEPNGLLVIKDNFIEDSYSAGKGIVPDDDAYPVLCDDIGLVIRTMSDMVLLLQEFGFKVHIFRRDEGVMAAEKGIFPVYAIVAKRI
ncbi:Alpha-N-methyltransferase NTM1 like protein [Aduncisulcus paluster]|uniref:Alpha N-terminal protein methyltransferase 1 n=1 Tax=Aduncisulcus paluster TaxID=2918883 RepID=A0ABQ5K891_9EUKA|nr:Alpha-N-methyltransferase NTM1 like protein [Aduncisulcus paluster]